MAWHGGSVKYSCPAHIGLPSADTTTSSAEASQITVTAAYHCLRDLVMSSGFEEKADPKKAPSLYVKLSEGGYGNFLLKDNADLQKLRTSLVKTYGEEAGEDVREQEKKWTRGIMQCPEEDRDLNAFLAGKKELIPPSLDKVYIYQNCVGLGATFEFSVQLLATDIQGFDTIASNPVVSSLTNARDSHLAALRGFHDKVASTHNNRATTLQTARQSLDTTFARAFFEPNFLHQGFTITLDAYGNPAYHSGAYKQEVVSAGDLPRGVQDPQNLPASLHDQFVVMFPSKNPWDYLGRGAMTFSSSALLVIDNIVYGSVVREVTRVYTMNDAGTSLTENVTKRRVRDERADIMASRFLAGQSIKELSSGSLGTTDDGGLLGSGNHPRIGDGQDPLDPNANEEIPETGDPLDPNTNEEVPENGETANREEEGGSHTTPGSTGIHKTYSENVTQETVAGVDSRNALEATCP